MAVSQDRTTPREGNPPPGFIADTFHLKTESSGTAAPAPLDPNEVEVVRAFNDFLAADRELDDLEFDTTREMLAPTLSRNNDAVERLIRYPATTTAAAALKLRVLLCAWGSADGLYNAALYNVPLPDEPIEDWADKLAWNLIGDLERMAKRDA